MSKTRKIFFVLSALLLPAGPLSASNEKRSFEANQKGIRYMEQGNFKSACEEFARASDWNPENKIISKNMAVACNNYAVNLMQDERYLEAREYLSRSAVAAPDDKSVRENLATVNAKLGNNDSKIDRKAFSAGGDPQMAKIANDFLIQGIQYLDKKEYDLARQVLQDSVDIWPKNATAHELLGDIAYLEQDLSKAKEYYTAAYRLKRSKILEEKIEKLGREAKVEAKMDSYSDEHFIIRYKEDAKSEIGSGFEIREWLRQAYKAISQDFGYYPKEKVVVLLYSEEEYRELSDTPEWTAGHFDGKIRLPAYKEKTDVKELRKVIWHELTHFFVLNLARNKCPIWLNEGLAQYQENKVKTVDVSMYKSSLRNKQLMSLSVLEKGIDKNQEMTNVYLFYQQSYMITKYLVEKYRMFKVKQMLTQYSKGRRSEQVFKDVLGISLKAFEIKWLSEAK